MVDPVVTDAIAPISYYPFDRAVMGNDLRDLGGNIGVTGMVNLIRNHAYISYEFTGQVIAGDGIGSEAYAKGFRAASFGPGWTSDFRWINFITGKVGGLTVGAPNYSFGGGDNQLVSTSIRDWYKWGARKFWLHHPFGRVSRGRVNQEASHYQVDAYYSAKHGCTCPFGGTLGNTPMPWLTDDVVDGITQGFVPLFKALITGSSADLSPDMWWRLTGTGADTWYDPNDPIEVVVYNGTINQETFRKWRRWFESSTPITNPQYFGATGETEGMPGNAYARYRLEQSFEPFRRAGMRLGLDAIPQSPGPVPTLNANPSVADMDRVDRYDDGGPMIPQGITYGAADEGWWKFFSEYVLKHWSKSDIFMEAHPETIEVLSGGWQGAITGYTMNPYQKIGGINIVAGDEYTRQGFGGSPNNPPFAPTGGIRAHYLGEYGQVEYLRSPFWSQGDSNPTKAGHVGTVIGGVTAWDGHYWYLREIAQPTTFTGSLPNLPNFAGGDRYLRAVSGLANYQGTPIWGAHVWGDHLIRYQYQKNDQTTPEQNKTIPGVLMNSTTLRSIPESVIGAAGSWFPLFGITYTEQFSIKYPKIQDYAKFLANVYAGGATMTLKGATTAGHPVYNSDVDSVVVGAGAEATVSRRIDGVSPVLFLDPYEWDTFAQTNLRGMKPQEGGGSFYIPTPDVDLPQGVLDSWLDMKVSAWKKTFGQYPKYIAWKMTKDTRVLYSQLVQFQMDRFLYNPNSVPLTPGENSNAFSVLSTTGDTSIRRNYFALPPYWNGSAGQGMLNQGYQIGTANQSENSLFTAAKTIVNQMLERTKAWRDKRKFTGIKVGLDNFPYIPEVAYSVYSANSSGVISLVNEAYWNDEVFPREKPRANVPGVGAGWLGGQDGWLTPAETEDLKKCIRLEYRKRLEPVANSCEFVMPEVLCKTPDDIPSDPLFKARLAQQRELADLCYSMKVNLMWPPQGGFLPYKALEGKPVLPVTSLGYGGATADVRGITLNPGDPVSTAIGTLFDRPKFNRSVIDPLRDNYFRPVRGIPRKIDGLVFRNDYDSRVFNAMSTQSYAGRTADRQWVMKWLAVDMGSGATVDWNNPTDVENKIDMFFDIRRRFTAQFADRFDRGQPRIDVTEDPYEHDLFAATWHTGYRSGLHPEVAEDGTTLSDVVPSIFPGHTYGTLLLRTGGQTSIPTAYFNEAARRIRLIPEGRRVVIPYFWHEDPVSDQSAQIDYWKATSDGVTYTGMLPYRLHETPGTVKFHSPWAYEQTAEAATSIRNFISDLAATGAYVDYIADDAEAWGTLKLSSVANAYTDGFGPTGMPAPIVVENNQNIIRPLPSWRQVPDPRQTPAIVADPRFANLPNSFNEKSMAQIITEELPIFYNNRRSSPTPIRTNPFTNPATTGLTAAQFLHFYIHEGVTGVSGATGGPVANFGDIANPIVKSSGNTGNPWRQPWKYYNQNAYTYTLSPYMVWYAHTAAIEDFVMGDLVKKCWIDTIAGFTNERIRGIGYSHYAISPTGITEGMLVASDNGHPPVVVSNYPWIDAAPELYGELSGDLRKAKYMIPSDYAGSSYATESDEFKRHQFAVTGWRNLSDFSALPTFYTSAGINPVTNENTTGVPARSYIALIKEMQRVRATLRYRPDAWKRFNPWVTLSVGTDIFQHGWRWDQTSLTNIWDKTTPEYGDELVRHCIVSGARHINYFFRGGSNAYTEEIGTGYTAGLIAMQNIISDWKNISGGLRAQPVSTVDGSPNTLQERIVMADVGGNHAGATGILMSGCKLLKYDTDRKSGSNTREEDWIWRLTAAPQADKMYLQSGELDLPPVIDLTTGSTAWFDVSTNFGAAGGFTPYKIGEAEYKVGQVQGPTLGFIISTGITQATRGNGGVELRHHDGLAANDTHTPNVLGIGKEMEFKFYTKKVTSSSYDNGFYNATPGASAAITFVGFYDFVEAFGNHHNSGFQTGTAGTVVSSPKPFFGLKSGLGFSQVGGSYGRAHVAWYDPNDTDNPYKCSVIQYPESSTSNWFGITFDFTQFNELGIEVEPDGSEARFLFNGQVIRSITAGTVDASGNPIRIPTAQWTEDGRGLWAGAAVRDMTLAEGGTSIPGAGGPPELLFIWSDTSVPQKNSKFSVTAGENDALVKASRYGAWIKRKSPVPPVYKISDEVRDDISLTLTDLEATTLGTTPVTKTYNVFGINTLVDIRFSFSPSTYAGLGESKFTIKKGGTVQYQVDTTNNPNTSPEITVVNGDTIVLEFYTTRPETNFTVTLTNVTTGDTIGTIDCFYGGEIPEIQDASDYEVWASSWIGDILVVPPSGVYYSYFPYTQYTATNTNVGVGGVAVNLKAVVPAISLNGQYSTVWNYPRNGENYGGFNGYRRPDDYDSIGETDTLITQLKTRLNYSPPGRRVYKNRFLSRELFYDSRAHLTTLMDSFTGAAVIGGETIPYGMGYTYEYSVGGTTYTAFIADLYPGITGFDKSKALVVTEASKLANRGVSFDWFMDDHESQQYWHLFGLNAFNYWGGICAATGLPIDKWGGAAYRPIMPDARVVSGLAQNPIRGYNNSETVHPVLGISFGKMFVQNYRDLSGDLSVTESNWKTFIAPLVGVTGLTAYRPESSVWTEFPNNSGSTGYDRIPNGYTFSRFVNPAWNATVDMFHHGGYLYEMYNTVYGNPASPIQAYKDVKFMQYDIYPVEPQEVQFTSFSNADKFMQRRMPSTKGEIYCSMGSVAYGLIASNKMLTLALHPSGTTLAGLFGFSTFNPDIKIEVLRDGKTASSSAIEQSFIGSAGDLPLSGSAAGYTAQWETRSGYVRNPVSDEEKYTWKGHYVDPYNGPAGDANLVRYPLTMPYGISGATLEPLYGDVLDRFWNELSYKHMVQYVKQLRLTHRSDTDLWKRWCPWIGDPGWEDSVFSRGLTGAWTSSVIVAEQKYAPTAPGYTLGAMRMAGLPYWYEQTFHDILHGAQHFQHWRDTARVDRGGIGNLQNVLDEWRRVSNNSRAQPVVASVAGSPGNCGALGATIDRITLWEAFDKPIISGGLLLTGPSAGWRVWRVTAAPHHFDYANNAYLLRTDTTSAFPAGITLNRYVGGADSLASLTGGRGIWLSTTNTKTPSYRFADRRISPINNLGDIRFFGETSYQVAPDSLVTITGPSGPEAPVWLGLTFSVGGTYPIINDKYIQVSRNGIGLYPSFGKIINTIDPETALLTFTGGSGDAFAFLITDESGSERMDFNVSLLNITDPVAPITLDTFRVAHWYLPNNSLYDGTLPDLQPTSYGSAGATSSVLSLVGFDYPNPDITVAVTFGAGIYPKGNGPWSPSTLSIANTGGFGLSALVTLPSNGTQPNPSDYQGYCILNKLGEGIQLVFSAGGDTADFPVSLFRYSPNGVGEGAVPALLDTFQCRFTPITTIDIPDWKDLSVATVTSSAGATVDTGVVLGGAANTPIALGISFGGPTLPQANDARITMSWPGGSTVFAPNTSTASSITTIKTSGVTTGFVVGQGVTFAYTSFGGRAADFNMSVFNRSNGDQLLDTIPCGFDHDPVVDTPTWANLNQFITTTSQTLTGFNCPVTIRPSWSGSYTSTVGTISNALIIRKNGVIVGSGGLRQGAPQAINPPTFTAYPGDSVEFEWSTNNVTSAAITVTVSRDSFPEIFGLLPFINSQTLATFTLSV